VGLGLRHQTSLDQAGRDVQLGADRRYTGPDCPPEMLAEGESRRATVRRCHGSTRARLRRVVSDVRNGTRFELDGERIAVSTRAHRRPAAAPGVVCSDPGRPSPSPVPPDRLPALLPEWGYGFWRAADVHEHRTTWMDDYQGFRRHGIPLDAIVIDSPWATQYNTWEFNPHQFPDAPGDGQDDARGGVRTVLWVTRGSHRLA